MVESQFMKDQVVYKLIVGRQPQPWHDVDATQNHGGAIGFSLLMVHFFRFQLSESL